MRLLWVLTLGLVISTAIPGCMRRPPEPIPGPKATSAMAGHHVHAAGIAFFQGTLDEAFARTPVAGTCDAVRTPMAPLAPELPPRPRNRPNVPPAPSACRSDSCPPAISPRRPLV
jgi:hypothetical protein